MKNIKSRFAGAGAVIFEIIAAATLIICAAGGKRRNVFMSFLAAFCALLPFTAAQIAKIKDIVMPESFTLVSLLFVISAQYFGEVLRFYYTIWWWDLLLHGVFGLYAVVVGVYITCGIIIKDVRSTDKRFFLFTVIFAFCFSMAIGQLWELFEFVGDYLFKSNMMKEGLKDTMTDLLASTVTAAAGSVVYYLRKRKQE
ncbi:MAG: hypothetical protein Q8930_11995 [Bacillota bacterium]|nr:hypothetical protein [Bacillota bacterium]